MSIKPDYYKNNGKDLLDRFEEGLLTEDEVRGFYKGNIIKYTVRYKQKNGLEDLLKSKTYIERLFEFERKHFFDNISEEQSCNYCLNEYAPVGTYSVDENKKATTPCSVTKYNPKKDSKKNIELKLDQSKYNYHFFE